MWPLNSLPHFWGSLLLVKEPSRLESCGNRTRSKTRVAVADAPLTYAFNEAAKYASHLNQPPMKHLVKSRALIIGVDNNRFVHPLLTEGLYVRVSSGEPSLSWSRPDT